jgi:hypothetical protein
MKCNWLLRRAVSLLKAPRDVLSLEFFGEFESAVAKEIKNGGADEFLLAAEPAFANEGFDLVGEFFR